MKLSCSSRQCRSRIEDLETLLPESLSSCCCEATSLIFCGICPSSISFSRFNKLRFPRRVSGENAFLKVLSYRRLAYGPNSPSLTKYREKSFSSALYGATSSRNDVGAEYGRAIQTSGFHGKKARVQAFQEPSLHIVYFERPFYPLFTCWVERFEHAPLY